MKHHYPNPDPGVPCLFCDPDPDDPDRLPTPWRTSDGYALCEDHARENAADIDDEENE
jgi:hypothetical protein